MFNGFRAIWPKTRRLIKESPNLVDGVVEIVDARIPYSSSNPEIDDLIKNKPRIILLNKKSDVADPKATKNMDRSLYKSRGFYALSVDCRSGKDLNQFIPECKKH